MDFVEPNRDEKAKRLGPLALSHQDCPEWHGRHVWPIKDRSGPSLMALRG